MSPAWYEFQPEAIVQTAGDYSSAVIPAVTPAEIESVTAQTAVKPSIDKRLQTPIHPLHLLHPKEDTLSLPLLPHQRPCYCCKGSDYWLAGTEQYPHWVCRRCHPPAPGAERIPDKP